MSLEHMRAHGFNLGGEQSGHIILSDYATTGDGLVAALQLLAGGQAPDRPVSEVCHRFEPVPQILKSVRTGGGKPPAESSRGHRSSRTAASGSASSGRLVVRASGTEPVIRVMAEGDDRDLVTSIVDELVDALTRAAA